MRARASEVRVGAEFEHFGSTADVAFFHGFATGRFCSGETVEAAVKRGVADRSRFDGWRRALDRWKAARGAVAAIAWGHATG